MADEQGATEDKVSDSAAIRKLLLDHLPLVVTGLLFFFVFLKLFLIAHGRIQTALGMLSAAGTVNVVLGTLLSSIGFLAVCIALTGAYFVEFPIDNFTRWIAIISLVGGSMLAVMTAPFWTSAIVLALGIFSLYQSWTSLRSTRMIEHFLEQEGESKRDRAAQEKTIREKANREQVAAALLSVIPLVLITLFAFNTPWIPAEEITFNNGHHTTGYILGSETDSLVFLTDDDRLIERIDLADVKSRQICRLKSERKPWIRFWTDDRTYPRCRD